MTDLELQQLRREKWRLDGKPIRTIEQARAFLEEVGFCLMYPKRPALLVPTFIGAFVGSDSRLPEWQHAFKDPRAAEATELMVRLLRERNAFDGFPYTLSFSVGVAHFDPAAPPTIETLLATADAMLLEQKKNRRADVALVEVAGR